jgi:hypothetical protein
MATSEIDIWRTAKVLVDGCGADAVILAAMRADQFFEQGDLEGRTVWLRVKRAIEELLLGQKPDDVTLN